MPSFPNRVISSWNLRVDGTQSCCHPAIFLLLHPGIRGSRVRSPVAILSKPYYLILEYEGTGYFPCAILPISYHFVLEYEIGGATLASRGQGVPEILCLLAGAKRRGCASGFACLLFQKVCVCNIIEGYGIDVYVSSDHFLDIATAWHTESRHRKCENSQ